MSHADESSGSNAPRGDGILSEPPAARRGYPWLPTVIVIVLILLVGAAILIPAIGNAREAARRASCSCHLKQLGLALQTYHDAYQRLPPVYFADAQGRPVHSWRTIVLPYCGGQEVYERYDFDVPWDGPGNRALLADMPKLYRCPSDMEAAPFTTNYVTIVGDETAWPFEKSQSLANFTDGTSNTAVVVEVTGHDIPWAEPRDLEFATLDFHVNDKSSPGISSHHPGGVMALMGDGSARMLPNNTDAKTMRAVFTIAAGDKLSLP